MSDKVIDPDLGKRDILESEIPRDVFGYSSQRQDNGEEYSLDDGVKTAFKVDTLFLCCVA
jgi:hypothetical protein